MGEDWIGDTHASLGNVKPKMLGHRTQRVKLCTMRDEKDIRYNQAFSSDDLYIERGRGR